VRLYIKGLCIAKGVLNYIVQEKTVDCKLKVESFYAKPFCILIATSSWNRD
jgi:hypothetical protein